MRGLRILLLAVLAGLMCSSAAQATFSGKNGRIAFSVDEEIFTANPDGSDLTPLGLTGVSPRWSPDGAKIAYVFGWEMFVADADGSDPVSLGSGSNPRWSPDGSHIAFVLGRDVLIVAPDGSGRHAVTSSNPPYIAGAVAWSPDETKLAYSEWFCDRPSGCDGHLSVVDADGANDRQVVGGVEPADPEWSPNGERILWRESNGLAFHDIYTIRPDGTDMERLTTYPQRGRGADSPTWSPNGQRILLGYHNLGPPSELRVMDADGSNEVTLAESETVFTRPRWSPDGQKIVFARRTAPGADQFEIRVMNADGSGSTQVFSGPGLPGSGADWQPIPIHAYPRPRAATSVDVSLVPAYDTCTAPNRTHGPPLAFGSCAPPALSSEEATLGTPDANGRAVKSVGVVRVSTLPGDVRIAAEVLDVYDRATLADYSGQLQVRAPLRITDKRNTPAPGGPSAATVADATLDATLPCSATADTTTGSSCLLNTSANAVAPGTIIAGARSVWELGKVRVSDGGADGDVSTSGDNQPFLVQGLFVP